MEYLAAWGTLIHEKNLKSKISCQTPFKPGSILHDRTLGFYGKHNPLPYDPPNLIPY